MELVLLLRDGKLLQSGSIKLLARRRRRLGVDLAMGRAPVAVALVQTERTVLRRAVCVARGVGVTRLPVARSVAVPAVVIVERHVLVRLGGRHRDHGERANHEGHEGRRAEDRLEAEFDLAIEDGLVFLGYGRVVHCFCLNLALSAALSVVD